MAEISVAAASADELGEAPLWSATDRKLWWVDIHRAALQSLDLATREHQTYRLPRGALGSFGFAAGGGFVVAADRALESYDPASRDLREICRVDEGLPNRLNDGKCDRRGRYWVGTLDLEISKPSGSLYRIGPDGSVKQMLSDVLTPNSVAFSPDDRTFYFSDTRRFKIYAFDFDIESGELSNQRVFRDTTGHPGRPDGSTVDAEGYLWNAEFAGSRVVRYAPDGSIDRVLELPVSQPTSVAFGGDDLSTLFITTARLKLSDAQLAAQPMAGHLLMAHVEIRGLPEPAFGVSRT